MTHIILKVTFKLNDDNFLDDWKKMSADINADLALVDGFISRQSARGEEGTIYCLVQWESQAQHDAFRQGFESHPDFAEMMAEFSRIVNMETMKEEVLMVV
ncbi:MAG: hypothetical protein KAH22_02235 [Thiotrichaceae bacterium]|nr:hypothetical protein [Thiotrichaceae bacterium]